MLFALLGSCSSLLYELILSKQLSFYTGEFILWQSLSLGVYLAALGCGVFFQTNQEASWNKLYRLELSLVWVGGLSTLLLTLLHALYRIYFASFYAPLGHDSSVILNMFATCSLSVIALVAFVAGQELPLILKLFARSHSLSLLLSLSYLGALLGSIIFGATFLNHCNMIEAACWTASINLFLALLAFFRSEPKKLRPFLISTLAPCFFLPPSFTNRAL